MPSLTFKQAATVIRPDQSVQFSSEHSFQVFEKEGYLNRIETFLPILTASFLNQMNKSAGFLLTRTDHRFEEKIFYKLYYYLNDFPNIVAFISAYIDEEKKRLDYFTDAYQKIDDQYHYFHLDMDHLQAAKQFFQELETILINEPCYRLRYVTGELERK